jgi:2-methylisocitrate lyase-like PEP mutase family enzyme
VAEWKQTGGKPVPCWHLALFSAMKAVDNAVRTLKATGTTASLQHDIARYSEYAHIVKLSTWLALDERYGV